MIHPDMLVFCVQKDFSSTSAFHSGRLFSFLLHMEGLNSHDSFWSGTTQLQVYLHIWNQKNKTQEIEVGGGRGIYTENNLGGPPKHIKGQIISTFSNVSVFISLDTWRGKRRSEEVFLFFSVWNKEAYFKIVGGMSDIRLLRARQCGLLGQSPILSNFLALVQLQISPKVR